MTRDVFLFDTYDGGEITQDLEIRDGLETSAYLSLFGGNVEDDGSEKSMMNWWGNLDENNQSRIYRATTAHLLSIISPTASNLRRVEDAAKRDLAWMVSDKISKKIEARASMPGRNQVHLRINIDGVDPLEFRVGWGSEGADPQKPVLPPPEVLVNNAVELSGRGFIGAALVVRRAGKPDLLQTIPSSGVWTFTAPYPLDFGEEALVYVQTLTGLRSNPVKVLGVEILRYDGKIMYDGTQRYDGLRKP